MGYANQFLGPVTRGAAGDSRRPGEFGVIADLTPRRGRPFERCRGPDLAVVYLVAPTTPPARRAAIAAPAEASSTARLAVGVTGARASLPPTVGRLVRDVVAASPCPSASASG
jgi:tryptophan synthase alpha subunit